MHFLDILLNMVFPTKCISCQKSGADLCRECLCACPPAERPTEEWIFPFFDYRHKTIKEAVWLLKYKNRKGLAKIFAEVMYGKIIEELADLGVMQNFKNPLLVPIPLSKKRHQERGYNQAELICRELIKLDISDDNFKLETSVLFKTKETEHQARIKDRESRLRNLKNSFAVKNPELIKNKNVILVDDVTTTGTTLEEAKKILKQSGAKKIIAFTVAH